MEFLVNSLELFVKSDVVEMAKLSLLFILSACLALTSAISLNENANTFIVGGSVAPTPNPYTFVCSLHFVWPTQEFHICGAALINPLWALTAAQCFFFPLRPSYFSVHCGVSDLTESVAGRERRNVERIVVHEGFEIGARPENFAFNIAMVRFSQAFALSTTISQITLLPEGSSQVLNEVIAMGWGVYQNTPQQLSNQLRAAILSTTATANCHNVEALEILPEFNTTLCAVSTPFGISTCVGDYGGPLVYHVAGNQFILVGIAYGSQRPCGIGTSAFIDVRPFVSWVFSILLGN